MIDGIRLREQVAQTAGEALIAISQEELDALCQAILDARRIFVAGWGRAGNVIRLLSMNCSQMGLKTHIVGDNSTPSIHEGDLLVKMCIRDSLYPLYIPTHWLFPDQCQYHYNQINPYVCSIRITICKYTALFL